MKSDPRKADVHDCIIPARLDLAVRLIPTLVEKTNPKDLDDLFKTAIDRATRLMHLYNSTVEAELFLEEQRQARLRKSMEEID